MNSSAGSEASVRAGRPSPYGWAGATMEEPHDERATTIRVRPWAVSHRRRAADRRSGPAPVLSGARRLAHGCPVRRAVGCAPLDRHGAVADTLAAGTARSAGVRS